MSRFQQGIRGSSLCREGKKAMGRFLFVSFGLLVVFLSLSGTGADFDCPSGWSAYDQYCYQIFKHLRTWEDAERFCSQQAKGGHLVSIESDGEADFVAQLVAENIKTDENYVWIGLRVQNKGQQCGTKWSDGSSVSYENWVERESKTCLGLEQETNHKWVNLYCGHRNTFVCKA
ncbi:snaclec coagulation factor IX-binding protein subunit A-like isoform X2 [Crotalus tigris]|uniref:snaclec coagulation factor IX-binding protein subunit A-like isoform X2 n=1 Tax=Crotalus tigris TaxID=88082 RepID=UPI00192F9586|nr:snaclec coagulation factor IX-binding protein subunit A-like isoform X2 [Crotalus tigris]